MRRLIWALLFACLTAHAGARVPSHHYRKATSSAALSFLVAGGGAASMMSNTDSTFANAYSSDVKQGNWFLLQGDGESEPGGLSLSAVGSPETQALRTCGNGAYCGSVTGQRLSDGNNFATAASATPRTGDFSACALVQLDSIADAPDIVMQWTGVTATSDWAMTVSAAGTPGLTVSNGSASTNTNGGVGSVIPRAVQLICVTYDFVADGTSVGKVYVDGVQGGSGSSTLGGLNAGATAKLTVGSRNGTSAATNIDGRVLLAFKTDTLLSASTISSMASALLGAGLNVYSADGTALTISRASPISCPWDENWSGLTVIPSGRPCVTMGGLLAAPGATNLVLRSEEIDNASWTKTNATVAANAVLAPDGSFTGDKLLDDVTNSSHRIRQSITKAASAIQYTHSVLLMPDEMTFAIVGLNNGAETAGTYAPVDLSTCTAGTISNTTFTSPSVTTQLGVDGWCSVRLTTTSDTDTTIAPVIFISTDNTFAGRNYVGQGFGIYIWGDMVETGGVATPPIRTEASTVTRASQTASLPAPTALSDAAGCVAARVFAFATSNGPNIVSLTGGTGSVPMLMGSGGTSMRITDGTTPTEVAGLTTGVAQNWLSSWVGSTKTISLVGGSSASGAFDGTIVGTGVLLGAASAYAVISDVKLGASEGDCQ